MATGREIERLQEENKALYNRLSSLEEDLHRKDEILKAGNIDKAELIEDLRKSQKRVKELYKQLEESENAEFEVAGELLS